MDRRNKGKPEIYETSIHIEHVPFRFRFGDDLSTPAAELGPNIPTKSIVERCDGKKGKGYYGME